ncbi:MAG: glycine cleavage system protein H [Ectothiorhodospiraceae bacterium]|nr:glycine cleavage system protein H [Ectothiorhodospiraceae bacterium]
MNDDSCDPGALPDELLYSPRAEMWLRFDADEVVVGSTHLAASLGEFVAFTPKRDGRAIDLDRALGVMEVVKAVVAIHAPLSAVIVAHNAAVREDPSLANRDPYGEGWLFRLRPTRLDEERGELVSRDAYVAMLNAGTAPDAG